MSYLLQITNKCSAQCVHCNYNQSGFEDIGLWHIKKQIIDSNESFFIITGGEPLECNYLYDLICYLTDNGKMFRICTGGHIFMIDFLLSVSYVSGFVGVSFGTDVFIEERNQNKILKDIWCKNIKVMNDWNVRYSITITIDNYLDVDGLLFNLVNVGAKPDFFMINECYLKDIDISVKKSAILKIKKFYPKTEVVYGFEN